MNEPLPEFSAVKEFLGIAEAEYDKIKAKILKSYTKKTRSLSFPAAVSQKCLQVLSYLFLNDHMKPLELAFPAAGLSPAKLRLLFESLLDAPFATLQSLDLSSTKKITK